jgi:hypothetical protein
LLVVGKVTPLKPLPLLNPANATERPLAEVSKKALNGNDVMAKSTHIEVLSQ